MVPQGVSIIIWRNSGLFIRPEQYHPSLGATGHGGLICAEKPPGACSKCFVCTSRPSAPVRGLRLQVTSAKLNDAGLSPPDPAAVTKQGPGLDRPDSLLNGCASTHPAPNSSRPLAST